VGFLPANLGDILMPLAGSGCAKRSRKSAYVLPLFLIYLFIYFLTILVRPVIIATTRFATLVELWLQMNDLKLVFPSLEGRCRGNPILYATFRPNLQNLARMPFARLRRTTRNASAALNAGVSSCLTAHQHIIGHFSAITERRQTNQPTNQQ